MTPEEFGARAAAAVDAVEPDPASYAWLTRNVARRARERRLTWAAAGVAAVTLAGVAVAVLPGDGAAPSGISPASPSESATSRPASSSPPPSALPSGARTADVDGDGTQDVVTIVYRGSRSSPDWQWGVRVVTSSSGTVTSWQDPCCTDPTQRLGPFADFDGDGRYEISASPGAWATSRYWYLLTFGDGDLMGVSTSDLVTGVEDGRELSWGCAERGGMVRTSAVPGGTTGTRIYYQFSGGRMIETSRVNDTWGGGKPRPAEYDAAFECA